MNLPDPEFMEAARKSLSDWADREERFGAAPMPVERPVSIPPGMQLFVPEKPVILRKSRTHSEAVASGKRGQSECPKGDEGHKFVPYYGYRSADRHPLMRCALCHTRRVQFPDGALRRANSVKAEA